MRQTPGLGFTLIELLVVIAIIGILILCLGWGQPIFVLLFGWAIFLYRTVPNATVDWLACTQAAVAVVLMTAVAHYFLRWLYGQAPSAEGAPPRRWKLRWTLSALVVVVFLFVAGISLTALAHQVGWLFGSGEPWMEMGSMGAARRAQSSNNLKQIGLAFHNYHDTHESLPPGGTFNEFGEMQHGWVTMLLPYLEYGRLEIDYSVPWDHPNNREAMQTPIESLQNPAIPDEYSADANGYALAHYAANSHLVGGRGPLGLSDIPDGTSNTILAGEIVEGFKPWGHPLNWRDPAIGLDVPGGFGSPHRGGVIQVLMADGSVQTLSADVHPAVLRALATPAGEENLQGLPSPW
jgi:prepilin-type N-terminal cleavage/methylation domain-containing protein/prepilin-type processing-associated H-X9-DG protein